MLLIPPRPTMADSTLSTAARNLIATNNAQTGNDRSSSSSTQIKQHNNNNNSNKRIVCSRCYRPIPKACICEGLPDQPIELQHCHVLVLQHPHEARRKNRSLPLVELTLSKSSITTVVSRRFGDQNPSAISLLQKSNRTLLIFPEMMDHCSSTNGGGSGGDDGNHEEENRNSQVSPVLSLSQAKEYCGCTTTKARKADVQSTNNNSAEITNKEDKILIVLLDATWKFAKEMDKANIEANQYPKNMKRVALDWDDPARPKEADKAFRFDIRTAPSQVHLSTAECLAWVLAALEERNDNHENNNISNNNYNSGSANSSHLYNALMKPLDVMVEKWNACRKLFGNDRNDRKRKAGDDDNELLERNSSKDYSYYGNQDVQAEQSSIATRSSFFTMGDQHNKTSKKPKSRGNKSR